MGETTNLGDIDIVILAGGEGRRMREAFPQSPKALLPVGGRPFIGHLLDQVRAFGARRVILALGHLSDAVVDYVKDTAWENLEILTHIEAPLRGTGGAVLAVRPILKSSTTLIMNGDSYVRADLRSFLVFHRSRPAAVSMLLTYQGNMDRFGTVVTDGEGRVQSFLEKEAGDGGYINAGLYLMERAAIAAIPPGRVVSLEREVFPGICGHNFYAMKGRFSFIDVGTAESYARADTFFREASPVS